LRVFITWLGVVLVAAPARAQIDYRNLDHGRPGAVEDAYPVERYGFEFSTGSRVHLGSGAGRYRVVQGLAYGLFRGGEVAVHLPLAGRFGSSGGPSGLAGADLSLLMNLSVEQVRLPALAVRLTGSLPTGAAAGEGTGVTLAGLATRSFGRNRIHVNASLALATPEALGAREGPSRWSVGLAIDRTLIRSSTLLIVELEMASARDGEPWRYSIGLGARRQIASTWLLDAGLGWEAQRQARSEAAVTVGVSHSFGIAGIMPRGAR
jgi:hypothetical protein